MFYRDEYHTKKPISTLMSKLFGWSRIYFHSQLFLGTYLYMHKRKQTGQPYYLESVYRGTWNLIELIERCGGKLSITGMDHIRKVDGPVIFVSNHMSTIETTVLPCLAMPTKRITFILKEELMKVPVFSASVKMLRSIAVSRKDPIADFKIMLKEGMEHIAAGTSIVVFPQTTRTTEFNPEKFGSVGIKLAKRAGIPVIPIAVKTDFLENGKLHKDFGRINPKKTVHIAFGEAINIEGNGKEQHQQVIDFIQSHLDKWQD